MGVSPSSGVVMSRSALTAQASAGALQPQKMLTAADCGLSLGKGFLALMQCSRGVSDCCLWVPLLQMKGHNNRSVFSAKNALIQIVPHHDKGQYFETSEGKKKKKIYLGSVDKKPIRNISL